MGKFKNLFGFGKDAYRAPQVSPVPETNTTDQNGTYINEPERQFIVKIIDTGKPQDLSLALGTLEVAKDVIKQQMSAWHLKDQRRKAILVPANGNGHG